MAKESGINVLLKVGDGATPTEVFTTLGGQQSTRFGGASEVDDITDKANGGWQSRLAVLRGGTVTATGKCDWPDTAGLEALRVAWHPAAGGPPAEINCELILNAAGDKYSGGFTVSTFEIDGPHNAASSYNIVLENTGALTYTAGS